MKQDVTRILRTALDSLGITGQADIEVEVPKVEAFGDVSTPLAMGLAKRLRKAPKKIAEEIIGAMGEKDIFSRVEIAGAGFINFTFTKKYRYSLLRKIIDRDRSFLREDVGGGRRVLVEFVSANPTGPLHVGHARGAAVGNALCNLLYESGFRVEREYYINDAGRQVKLLGESVFARYRQQVCGDSHYRFPEDGYKGEYILSDIVLPLREGLGRLDLCNKAFEEVANAVILLSYERMLGVIRDDLLKFGVSFDRWASEKLLYERGEVAGAIASLKEKDFLYEKEGALWFRSTEFGDDKDRVIIKGDGDFTYFASDIAYHKDKLDRGYDVIIDIWGADHHGYIPRIESVMKAFGYDSSKFRVILVQMVNLLKHGQPFQMSKRAGTFVTLDDVTSQVGADTTKFMFLTRKSDSHLDFDIDVVTAQSAENPVYYVQYANARINSILQNAKGKGFDTAGLEEADMKALVLDEETGLIKKLLAYPMVLEGAARAYEPHRITFYLQEVAALFHSYYHRHKVLSDDEETTKARLALCAAIKTVIGDALSILGVTAPEKM